MDQDSTPFGLTQDQVCKLLQNGLKPEEISSAVHGKQHERVEELVRWFVRLADGNANPKWTRDHAFELAYYIATNGPNRQLNLQKIKHEAFLEGARTSSEERDLIREIVNDGVCPLSYELDGVIADVELGNGFDEVCLRTIKRVAETLKSIELLKEPDHTKGKEGL